MKLLKIAVFFLFALNVAIPLIQSCTKDTPKTDNPASRPGMESLVSEYNAGVLFNHEKALLLEGKMTVLSLPSKEVLFFLKQENEPGNQVFLGQGTVLSSTIQKDLGKVKVAYLREAIAIETEQKEIYTFTIGERKGHDLIRKLTPDWSGKGFGLAFNYRRYTEPFDYQGLLSTDDLVQDRATPSSCKCVEPQEVPTSNCTSGGTGASSCSIGATVNNGVTVDPGCTVSCATVDGVVRWYACCTASSQQ